MARLLLRSYCRVDVIISLLTSQLYAAPIYDFRIPSFNHGRNLLYSDP